MEFVKKYKWVIVIAVAFAVCAVGSAIKRNYDNEHLGLEAISPVDLDEPALESDIGEEYVVKININTADIDTLCELPHIGYTVAERIIEFRNEAGSFDDVRELMLVRGIGEKTFEKISKYITVE